MRLEVIPIQGHGGWLASKSHERLTSLSPQLGFQGSNPSLHRGKGIIPVTETAFSSIVMDTQQLNTVSDY
jgi:hypothetical protein